MNTSKLVSGIEHHNYCVALPYLLEGPQLGYTGSLNDNTTAMRSKNTFAKT